MRHILFVLFILFASVAVSDEFVRSDILSEKKVSSEALRLALANYINQFDPHHIYLLARDVAPFLQMTKEEFQREVDKFNNKNYSIFERLNGVIQRSIIKMRKNRNSFSHNEHIAKERLPEIPQDAITDLRLFAQNEQQLEIWQKIYMTDLVLSIFENLKSMHKQASFQEALQDAKSYVEKHENDYMTQEFLSVHILKALTNGVETQRFSEDTGIEIKELRNGFVVSGVRTGSSAKESGKIKIGDEIIYINSRAVEGMSAKNVLQLLEGKSGTTVTMTMKDKKNALYTVFLTRKKSFFESESFRVNFQQISGGILGIITLPKFTPSSYQDMNNAIDTLKKEGAIKGLIIDIRDNHGGILEQAIKTTGLFIKTGLIAGARDPMGVMHNFRDLDPHVLYTGPLILLISKKTAEGAAILAQALKDYGIAIVVGDSQSFSKQGDSVSGYFTVSGFAVERNGVMADIVVPGMLGEKLTQNPFRLQIPIHIDSIRDIPFIDRRWYQENYFPYLQMPIEKYRKWIPELAEKSNARLKENNNYQNLLDNKLQITVGQAENTLTATLTPTQAEKALFEMQEQEAVNIILDLITLTEK